MLIIVVPEGKAIYESFDWNTDERPDFR